MTVVGIDLGTTNSCVAILQNGDVHIIADANGDRVIPSIVTFTDDDVLVGSSAKTCEHIYPRNTVHGIKRLMGQQFSSSNVHQYQEGCNYDIVNDDNVPKAQFMRKGEKTLISPEEISSKILTKLKQMAEDYLHQEVREAVITVPAYFGGSQRSATKRAAKLAGFDVIHIINEPTAAALAFQYNNPKKFERKILIYDFGGGTFDVSVVVAEGKHCQVLATHGDCYLGGVDIDRNLQSYILEQIKEKTGYVVEDVKTLRRIIRKCEEAKMHLSAALEYEFDMESITRDRKGFDFIMTRQTFEDLNKLVFQKTLGIVEVCLSEANLAAHDIDEIIIVGGSSRIPKVQQMLKKKFGVAKLTKTVNPDEAVAFGAAIYAAQLQSDKAEVSFQDVLSLSLGISTLGDVMSKIMNRNTPLPCRGTDKYTTTDNFQTEILFQVYQGESLIASRNQFLGKFAISDIRKASRGVPEVLVTFSFDSEGLLTVSASEMGAENKQEIHLNMVPLSQEETEQRLWHTEINEEEELKYVAFAKKRNVLKGFCDDLELKGGNFNKGFLNGIRGVLEKAEAVKPGDNVLIDEMDEELRKYVDC